MSSSVFDNSAQLSDQIIGSLAAFEKKLKSTETTLTMDSRLQNYLQFPTLLRHTSYVNYFLIENSCIDVKLQLLGGKLAKISFQLTSVWSGA